MLAINKSFKDIIIIVICDAIIVIEVMRWQIIICSLGGHSSKTLNPGSNLKSQFS